MVSLGPVLSERQWGTVREDYSADGEAWDYLPHDHARSRAYRWGEDGLAGFCDIEQRLCVALALWNGRDPILKERAFGFTGAEANHGEDVKEYWWYLDAVPSHAWNMWRYHYPQRAFPYQLLLDENRRRGKLDPEYELIDTGVFDDDRYWVVDVAYAKADPTDILMTITVTNAGPDAELLHVLPTLWFRNTWSWEVDRRAGRDRGRLPGRWRSSILPRQLELLAGPDPQGGQPQLLFCENETNLARLYGVRQLAMAEGRNQRPCRQRRRHRQSRAAGHQVRGLVPAVSGARRDRLSCGCACARPELAQNRRRRSEPTSRGSLRSVGPRPTSSMPS